MGLYDRDYMRDDWNPRQLPKTVVVLGLVVSLIASATYLLKEFRYFKRATRPAVHQPTEHERLLKISPLDLNTATYSELQLLPHVDEAMATEIMSMRPINATEQLVDVYGIGDKRLSAIRPHVYIDTNTIHDRYPDYELPETTTPEHVETQAKETRDSK